MFTFPKHKALHRKWVEYLLVQVESGVDLQKVVEFAPLIFEGQDFANILQYEKSLCSSCCHLLSLFYVDAYTNVNVDVVYNVQR